MATFYFEGNAMSNIKVGDKVRWVSYNGTLDNKANYQAALGYVLTVVALFDVDHVIVSSPENSTLQGAVARKSDLDLVGKQQTPVSFARMCCDIRLVSPELSSLFESMEKLINQKALTKELFNKFRADIKPFVSPLSKKDDEESDYVLQHVKEMLLVASKHVVVDEHENKIKMKALKQKVLREKVPF